MNSDVLRRILIRANDDSAGPNTLFLFDEALRAERRATVERIRERLNAYSFDQGDHEFGWKGSVRAILDEEAARE